MKALQENKSIAVFILAVLAMPVGFGTWFSTASDITPQSVAAAVNNERSQRSIPVLNYNEKLAAAADYKAHDMITRKYFAHVDPNGHYIWDKIVADGYSPYVILGENLAINFDDTSSLVAAWIDSPTHRQNILNPDFKDQGVGVAFGNTQNGEYNNTIANTFGALLVLPHAVISNQTTTAPAQAQQTQPAKQKPASKPRPAPAPKPRPAPKTHPPAPLVQAAIEIHINNAETTLYNDNFVMTGTTQPNIAISITDKGNPAQAPITTNADNTGVFNAPLSGLANGKHVFAAAASGSGVQSHSNLYAVTIIYNPPSIDVSRIKITPYMKAQALAVAIAVPVSGDVQNVTATIDGTLAELKNSSSLFSGEMIFEPQHDFHGSHLVLTASNEHANQNVVTLALDTIAAGPANAEMQKGAPSKHADLSSLFRYIAVIFSGLFGLFIIADAVYIRQKSSSAQFGHENS